MVVAHSGLRKRGAPGKHSPPSSFRRRLGHRIDSVTGECSQSKCMHQDNSLGAK